MNATFSPTLAIERCFCNCFAPKQSNADKLNETYKSKGMQVLFLPIDHTKLPMTDLFPRANHVQSWVSMTVGAKQQYIVANTSDIDFGNAEGLLNTDGTHALSTEMRAFLEPLWEKTMRLNESLMLLCLVAGRTMLVNTFPLSYRGTIVGASLFMRDYASTRRSLDEDVTAATKKS